MIHWKQYADQAGFQFDYPEGWRIETTAYPSCVISSPDRLWIALIQPLLVQPNSSPVDVLRKLQFPTQHLFPDAVITNVLVHGTQGAEAELSYRAPDGSQARAKLVYFIYGKVGLLGGVGAPLATYSTAEPILMRIVRSHNEQKTRPASGPAATQGQSPQTPPGTGSLRYISFVDPEQNTFSIDVPAGWKVKGGFLHSSLGDRRPWFEANSPDGIYILSDPTFPQSLCHCLKSPAQGEPFYVGAGAVLINLVASAASSADFYLRQTAAKRLSGFTFVQRRARPEVAGKIRAMCVAANNPIFSSGKVEAIETILERKSPGTALTASLLSTCVFNGDYGVGTGFWGSNNILSVSPSSVAGVAEQVRTHMSLSMQFLPEFYRIAQEDESRISANSQAEIAARWTWFNAQQNQHLAHIRQGEMLMQNYWQQQRVNDSIVRGWEQNQAVYDRLSRRQSDAMLGKQRLYDDTVGLAVEAPGGENFYWRNQQTGEIQSTRTDQPPDYTNNYTPLRKLD